MFPMPAVPASLGSSGSSAPTSLLLLGLTMLPAGTAERRMEAAIGPATRGSGLPCHLLHTLVHMPGDAKLWL